MSIQPSELFCEECGKLAGKRCSRCHEAFYCGEACQKIHWEKGHKLWCRYYPPPIQHIGIQPDKEQLRNAKRLGGMEFMYLDTHIPAVMRRLEQAMKRTPNDKRAPREFWIVQDVSPKECRQAKQPGYSVFAIREEGIYLFKCPTNIGHNEQMRTIAKDLTRYANAIVHEYNLLNMAQLPSPPK